MKKAVGLLFSLILLASIVNAWGPLTHNAITTNAKGSNSDYLKGATGPDIYYHVIVSRDVSDTFHEISFATKLYNVRSNDNQGKMAIGWLTHKLADLQCAKSGFDNANGKLATNTLSYYRNGGRAYVDVYEKQVAKAFKDYTGRYLSELSIALRKAEFKVIALASQADALAPGSYSTAKIYVDSHGGIKKYDDYYSKSVSSASGARF